MRYLLIIFIILMYSCDDPQQKEMFLNRIQNIKPGIKDCAGEYYVSDTYIDEYGNYKTDCH